MDRIYTVSDLSEISRAMELLPGYMEEGGPMRLYQVVNTKPMNLAKRRTPLATTRRYTNYVRKDGTKTRTNRIMSGSTGMLRRSLGVRVRGMTVQFGTIHGDVVYAHRIHETANPREGQYWVQGMRGYGRGWTTKSTGNKYIEKPVRETASYVPMKLSELIAKDLEEVGL